MGFGLINSKSKDCCTIFCRFDSNHVRCFLKKFDILTSKTRQSTNNHLLLDTLFLNHTPREINLQRILRYLTIETNLSRNWNRAHSDVEPTCQDILSNILLKYMFCQNTVNHYTSDLTNTLHTIHFFRFKITHIFKKGNAYVNRLVDVFFYWWRYLVGFNSYLFFWIFFKRAFSTISFTISQEIGFYAPHHFCFFIQ